MRWIEELRFDTNGLLPVIAQDAATGEVLMLAHANREAVERTARSGRAHYWSRSRGELWRKGDTSGNQQEVVDIRVDCDADALLYRVRQTGPACHTGERSCFHRSPDGEALVPAPAGAHVLERVAEVVRARQAELPEGSYTTYLFGKGIDKILKKVGEEATEVVIAAKNGESAEIRAETADLFFHLLVMLRARDVPLGEVWEELESRFGAQSRLPRDAAAKHPHS